MTSLMHTSTGADIEVAQPILPLGSCGFGRHASIAAVCGAPRCDRARHEHPKQGFAMSRYRKHSMEAMPYLACSTGVRKLLTSSFPDGKNRRGSVPESSLTEDAEITPDGNVSAASAPAAIGVDDDPMFSGRPGAHTPMELLVERDAYLRPRQQVPLSWKVD